MKYETYKAVCKLSGKFICDNCMYQKVISDNITDWKGDLCQGFCNNEENNGIVYIRYSNIEKINNCRYFVMKDIKE